MNIGNRQWLLQSYIDDVIAYAQIDGSGQYHNNIVWNSSADLCCFITEGTVFECDPAVLEKGKTAVLKLVHFSIENEVWHRWSPPWPEAWLKPSLALIDDRWWREGVIDKAQVDAIFAKQEDWAQGSILVGIDQAERLLSVGAYHLVEPMQHTVNSSGGRFKRDFSPADRLGMLLASDPGQLHDPKSPVRKSARSMMKRNMESGWFMDSGGWMPFHWLRTFEWREGESGLSPRESMLRAYAYMPDVEPPAGIAREVEQLRKIPI
jgi:hypothetical protein